MTLKRKFDEFKAWLRDIFPSEDGIQDGPGGLFTDAHDLALNNPNMNYVHGNQYNIAPTAGDRKITAKITNLLSQHIIRGAAHDDSARDPPPRCHPETRVELIARITAWFEGQSSLELLLWITGPAGVGKSAVVQTFAEYLVESHLLGASVFLSRRNKRDNPHGVFITIAYQLATQIEAYRDYIVERLSGDPELLTGDFEAQFITFIVEPFTVQLIGAGGKRWGILLDGLDELRGTDAQCEIIRLISSFAHEHPNAPFAWIIASRPESHISNTFEDDEVRGTYRSEYIPIDSTEACEDVERFIRSSFETMQKHFRHCVSSDWPSNTEILKLTAAASGLFIYAQVVMQFIGDSHHADPMARLEALLSVIDRSNAFPTQEKPFVHLDALYHEILSSIPSGLWPTTKRLLGVAIYGEHILPWHFKYSRQKSLTLRGMSILFGVTLRTIYASLDKSRSTLKILDWKIAHKTPLTFVHASFSDYLKDSKRSRDFYVGSEEDVKEEVWLRLLEIWNKCCGDDIATSSIELVWHQYCSELTDQPSSSAIERFHTYLFHVFISTVASVVYYISRNTMEPLAYTLLPKLHMRKLCYFFKAEDVVHFSGGMMDVSPGSHHIGFFRKMQLKDLEFAHLDWKEMSPAYAHVKIGVTSKTRMIHRPRSSAELTTFVSDLKSAQEHSPELEVVIMGVVPKEQVAVFEYYLNEKTMCYIIPYPE